MIYVIQYKPTGENLVAVEKYDDIKRMLKYWAERLGAHDDKDFRVCSLQVVREIKKKA